MFKVNAKQPRDFARSINRLAKTDKIDARILALFGQRVRPEVRPLPDAQQQALAALSARRRQLIRMRSAEKNRLHNAPSETVERSVEAVVDTLSDQIEETERQLDEAVEESPIWKAPSGKNAKSF
ncbi:MAG: hypothetical protein BRD38_03915 [Bacteroidetes bacterium QH_9_67_14]|nr:MAG: hypothetical protein BRD38_03915 [Bacteroidetes bacterium QH_9_67_14]